MNTAMQVDDLIQQMISENQNKSYIVWNTALACIGWAYVYGAWGEYCTPANRRKR